MAVRRPAPSARASERLRRLLLIVPFVIRHPGTELAELSTPVRRLGVRARPGPEPSLHVQPPPYGPGDLIEVDVEGGRVWIGTADYFSRPVRLTRSEALALYLRGTALVAAPGLAEAPSLASALAKLEEALGPEALGALSGRVELGADPLLGEHLAVVRRAVEAGERLDVEYYSASRDELARRRIDPEHLFMATGHWYVVAWDDRSDEERMFRVDRLRSVSPTGETFEPRGLEGLGRPLYTRTERDVPVRLRLGPGARWVAEYYEVERSAEGPEGTLDVTIPAKDLAWTAKLVLRLAGEAEVLDPPELRKMVGDVARSALARYDSD